jgi:hypothetical protein
MSSPGGLGDMRIEIHGLIFETPHVSFHLWSPWRSSQLEHRLFQAVRTLPQAQAETSPDEWRVVLADARAWRDALQALERVLKGWQEEADPGGERRTWRWLMEGDADADGYDHSGEPFSIWGFLQVSLERGGPSEQEKAEDIDMHGFSFRIVGNSSRGSAKN